MCDMIAKLLEQDPRATKLAVNRYLKPHIEERGRYPDVYVEIDGLGKFAIEVQLSKPFAFEIAARHLHYQAEGVSLIWVFRNLADELPQGFRDVLTMQRGNAFLFDDTAFKVSVEAGKLKLSAYLESDRGWLRPRLVALDDLNRGSGRAVFLEDRRTAKLLDFCQVGRAKWWEALKTGRPFAFGDPPIDAQFAPAWDSIKTFVPSLLAWKNAYWREQHERAKPHFLEIAAMLFSIARSASAGKDRTYIARYKGEGSLLVMLNARLSGAPYTPYANLIEVVLAGTLARHVLTRSSLQGSLATARRQSGQRAAGHPVWDAAARLFPEVYDGMLRTELADLCQLPGWAAPDPAPDSRAARTS
jgi:hypothetical protein